MDVDYPQPQPVPWLYSLLGWLCFFAIGLSVSPILFATRYKEMGATKWLLLGVVIGLAVLFLNRQSETVIRFGGVAAGLGLGGHLVTYVIKLKDTELAQAFLLSVIAVAILWLLRRWVVKRWKIVDIASLVRPADYSSDRRKAERFCLVWRLVFWANFGLLAWAFVWVSVAEETSSRFRHVAYLDAIELTLGIAFILLLGRRLNRQKPGLTGRCFRRFWPNAYQRILNRLGRRCNRILLAVRNWAVNCFGGSLGVVASYAYFRQYDSSREFGVRIAWIVVLPIVMFALYKRLVMSRRLRKVVEHDATAVYEALRAREVRRAQQGTQIQYKHPVQSVRDAREAQEA